jgi:hypothetical protein
MGLPIVGKLLGHADQATTARYARLDNNPLRRASNVIGKAIAHAMDGNFAADRSVDSSDYRSLDTLLQITIISIRGGNESPIALCSRTTGLDRIGQNETPVSCPTKSNAFGTQLSHPSAGAANVGTRRPTDECYPALPATGRSRALCSRDVGLALLCVMAREARSRRGRANL